jgi:Spy/CpxP family protein refolding chaperone
MENDLMRKRTVIATVVLTVAIAVGAPLAFAQRRGMHADGGASPARMFHRLIRAKHLLGLTDGQVSQIEAIAEDLKTQNQPYRQALRGGFQAAAQKLLANPNDLAGAQALLDQQATAERTLRTNALNAASKALNVLTPEQRAKLAAFVQERIAKRGNR